MSEISEEEIRKRIKTILQDADLSTLSAKKVRKKLEEIFETDFTKRKKEVDAWTMELLTKQIEAGEAGKSNGQEEEDEEEEEEEKNEDENVSSDEDKPQSAPPKKKMKKERTPSKSSNDSDDNEDDAEVARRLQEEEETSSRRPSRSTAKKPVKRKERKKREKKEGVNSMYATPCYLSEDLSEIMGTNKMARSEVVKKMWQVVRERNLQDPKNKQWMICDDQLKKVFGGKAKIKTFTMMKYLKNHIKDVKDVS